MNKNLLALLALLVSSASLSPAPYDSHGPEIFQWSGINL